MGKFLSKENTKETEKAPDQPALEVPDDPTPTVIPQPEDSFKPTEDANSLNEAFKSFGANEAAITVILANRSWEQRQEIGDAYREAFKKSLVSEVDSELSGNYKLALEWLLLDPDSVRVVYISKVINENLVVRLTKACGTDVAVLETVFPLTKTEAQGLKKTYEKVSGNILWKDIEGKVTGPFKSWIVELIKTGRNEGNPNPKAIAKDVKYLVNLPLDTWSPEVPELQTLFCKQNFFHLYNVLNSYETEKGEKWTDVLGKVNKEFQDAFTAMVTACLDGYEFFADGLYKSMKGIGTNDVKLIYIMIDRCEYDLENIKIQFEIKYKKTLESFIKDDTSGDYKNLLIDLLKKDTPEVETKKPEEQTEDTEKTPETPATA